MITIIITGPSCSGKTILSNKLSKLFDDSIVIKTDSYYRDNLLIRLLSKFRFDIYDRTLSIKKNEIKSTLRSIRNQERFIPFSHYNFKNKKSSQSKINVTYNDGSQFLIVEGIFAHRLDLNYQDTINIVCKEKKEICLKRRLRRDKKERGRNSNEVNKRFKKSWYLFYKNINNYLSSNQKIVLNPVDKVSYNKLVLKLKNFKK